MVFCLRGIRNLRPRFSMLQKKAGEGKTAQKGRLCFDYRKVNALIKNKNFPLASSKNFFDNAAQFRYFSIVDIQVGWWEKMNSFAKLHIFYLLVQVQAFQMVKLLKNPI